MSTVISCTLPAPSALHARRTDGDFLDCYAAQSNKSPRAAAEAIVAFPGWAKALVALRAIATAPFGLRQDGPDSTDKLGPFPVEHETKNEIIAGFDDKHLNFRISVLQHDGRIHLATWVQPHNLAGRLYLAAIMPFHIMIARDGVARAARD
ncbi:MAG: DUF2867 domain-containing protein [Pseudomonadota bacterium]